MPTHPKSSPPPICQKCGTLLTPGKGDFYIVRLEAFAENSPPVITKEDLAKDHRKEMKKIAAQLQAVFPQEAMDMVHRQISFCLCTPCYKLWIENPTG
ncbi:MAG TPA: hypothetical protein VGN88_00795 [Phycisphaerae bacterium]